MKKVILLTLAILLSFYGCSNKRGNETIDMGSDIPADFTYAEEINTIYSDKVAGEPKKHETELYIAYPAYLDGKHYDLINWQDYILTKFGIKIEISYQAVSPAELKNIDLGNNVLYLSYSDGMTYQFNTRIFDYAGEEYFYDLTPYYNKYGWAENINPQHIVKLVDNEKIFAIPAYDKKHVIPRYYNKKLLGKLGLTVPRTVGEFQEFLRAAKDYNGNREHYYPMFTINRYLSVATSDIFRAFNVYLNSEFNSSITYNPITETIEDGVFSPDMENALEYIRMLQQEELFGIASLGKQPVDEGIYENRFLTDFSDVDKGFATEYGAIYDSGYEFFILSPRAEVGYDHLEGYYLEGTNTKAICEVRTDMSFYLFPKTIENIDGTVELFDMIFNRTEYYNDVKYGIEGKEYYIDASNNRISVVPPSKGSFVGLNTINIEIAEKYNGDGISMTDDIDSSLLFEKNVFTQIFAYAGDRVGLDKHMNTYSLDIVFNDNLTPYDAINEYKSNFTKLGGVKIIMDLNNRLGVNAVYDYISR